LKYNYLILIQKKKKLDNNKNITLENSLEGSVDRIFSNNEVHNCDNLNEYVDKLYKILKYGGRYFIRYKSFKTDETLILAEQISKEPKWWNKFKNFSLALKYWPSSILCDYLENAGLVWEKQKEWRNVTSFNTLEEYKNYISGWLPHLYHLNKIDREEFLEQLVSVHAESHKNSDKVNVEESLIEIYGYKPAKNEIIW